MLLVLLAGCMVGPARIGLVPRMAPIGQSPDPDPTRNPVEQGLGPSEANPQENVQARDPLPIGKRLSGAVSASALLFWVSTGKSPLLGIYGTFDETGLVHELGEGEKTEQ